jgi:hypothetical protein
VRVVARNVNTNRKRVESTTSARVFSERQLDAARKKFAVGLAQSIDVLIAQRDLATARFNELSSIIDYVKSLVELRHGPGRRHRRRPAGRSRRARRFPGIQCARAAGTRERHDHHEERGSAARAALASVAWADEIVVVDAGSTDATAEIARRPPAASSSRLARLPPAEEPRRDLATHDWILSIDADERVSPALAGEIRALLAAGPAARGYRVPRVTRAFGRELRATDWYPDWQLRLYDRRAGRWDETRTVHESVRVEGDVATLRASCSRRLPRSVGPPAADRSLHDAGRRGQRRARQRRLAAADRRPSAARVPAQLRPAAAASPPAPRAWWSRR